MKKKTFIKNRILYKPKQTKMIKTPQTSIEAFLNEAINISIYTDLEDNYLDGIDTLEFFNLVYSELVFYFNNAEKYLIIKEHFDTIDFKNSTLNKKFFYWLPKLIKHEFDKNGTTELKNKTLKIIEDVYFILDFAQVGNKSKNRTNFIEREKLEQKEISKLKFHGNQTAFIELIKALITNENLKGTQKDIINTLSDFFDIEIKNPNKIINDIKNRNNGSETLFLDELKKSLFNHITAEKKK